MIETYWRVGQRIAEEEQRGKERGEYGEQLINHLSARLTHEFGAGFSARYLRAFRKFYILMPDTEIWKLRFPNLTRTHIFRSLMVGDDTDRSSVQRTCAMHWGIKWHAKQYVTIWKRGMF